MKTIFRSMLAFALTLCLLAGVSSVMAEQYDYQDGVLPEGWTKIDSADEVTATNILQPANPNASREARNLYAYLATLLDTDYFLTGQFDIAGTNQVYEQVVEEFDIEPALYSTYYRADQSAPYVSGIDEQGNPQVVVPEETFSFTNVDSANALLLQHYENGNVLLIHSDGGPRMLCGELLIKKGLSMNTSSSAYVAPDGIMHLDKTNPDRDMQTYELWMRYQNNLVTSLKKLEDMGVKAYLWRPWVEFNDTLFTGATPEGKAAFVRVFHQTVQHLIDGGLTGFLTTFSPTCGSTALLEDRNPGNDYVDVYGVTMYSDSDHLGRLHSAYLSYNWYIRTGKPIGFTEISCRTGGWRLVGNQARASSFDLVRDSVALYPRTCFVNFWGDGVYSPINNNKNLRGGNDDGRLYLDSPFTLSLDEIVDYRNTDITAPGICQVVLSSDAVGAYHGLEQRDYTANDLKALGLDIAKLSSVRTNAGYAISFYESADCSGKAHNFVGISKGIPAATASKFRSCSVTEIPNISTDKEIYASVNDNQAGKANDGLPTCWNGTIGEDGTAWLMLDLGESYTVSRYIVQNAGISDGTPAVYNTRDFQIQYSKDGSTWTTVSSVSGNIDNMVARQITPVSARYWRLLITKANSMVIATEQNTVLVAEFQLFGVVAPAEEDRPSGVISTPETPDDDDNYYEEPGSSFEPGDDTSDPVVDEPETSDPSDNENNSSSGGKKKVVIKKVVNDFPWWIIVIIVAAAAVIIAIVILLILRRKKKTAQDRAA